MPENCTSNDCPLEPRISALERANEQHGTTHRELFKRMNEVERDNAVQDAHYKTISKKLDEIGATVKTMADQVRSMTSAGYAFGLADYAQPHYGYISFQRR